ncbi:hypothetical protein CVT24_009617 [Panaeolus cyanescens]|uniref:Carrier domain-containing protein n=1 Tax=Panaeolus cyanescens TaxID=181874 RepID=A0A409YA00_9AGAR|nr:hypothetical protein CVT24_009617 [Panaeolus cyanescens]
MDASQQTTLLNAFFSTARSAGGVERTVVECGNERWTYGDLDNVSTGLALDMHKKYGTKPVISIISENHPYTLATMLATWKLGGIIAPLDHNVPRDIMERMLLNIAPTAVVVSSTDTAVQSIIKDLSLVCHPFNPKDATITASMQRYLDQSPELPAHTFPPPGPEDIALYLHTSSASSVDNVKCVPLSHQSILAGSQARLAWWKRTWPQQDFENLRVLGWSPWSHVIGLSHDIGAAMILTAGSYIFAMLPSAYGIVDGSTSKESRYLDVCGQLLETAILKKPTAFAGVPWVLEGFMRTWKEEKDLMRKARIQDALQRFKIFGSGGAATNDECVQWANQLRLPLVLDIGMTELGGPIFHATTTGTEGWHKGDCLLSDAQLTLIDEFGNETSTEGELKIRSHFITKGYLQHDNSSFHVEADGAVSFLTGDVYGYTADQRLTWRGRKEDYIQMSSGESLDPRAIEKIINQCPLVARCCVVGNNFLKTSSQVVCAIIEPKAEVQASIDSQLPEITRAISTANRNLAPPLRISWHRVLVLKPGQQIPVTKKGAIFRKKLEQVFGEQLSALLSKSVEGLGAQIQAKPAAVNRSQGRTKDQVAGVVAGIIIETLRISNEIMESNTQATFAELGMDSAMATAIVNRLNKSLDLNLPLNTCHTYVDLVSLTDAVFSSLGMTGTDEPAPTPHRIAPPPQEKEDIVIVGQAVRLPGDINTPDGFWQALVDKREDIITPVPLSRWDHASFYRAPDCKDPPGPCDITLDRAGFIEVASFDHSFFGISSAEAFHVCPNIRLSMELAFEALENANIPISKIKGTDAGVFVAANMDEGYIKLLFADKGWGAYSRFYGTGVATSTACGRLSYLLDVHGPSFTVDTACSSGLIVLDHAVQYLQSGQGETAIVCGANTHAWPGVFGFLSAQKMTSPNARCATFTNMADGYVPSEGAAALIVKTKSAALRDGDRIIGVIRSTDSKHDGRSQGLVAPNVKAQIAMQIALLEKAGLSPSQIDFIEAHGTGTSLGDLIEIQGINEVFKSSHSAENPLVIGASKSCVGHTEIVAGLIGALKTLGTFAHGSVPGLVQLKENNMNPSLDCSVVPLHIPIETAPLKKDKSIPLRGMVLSNGFAGSIAGCILEAPSEDMKPPTASIIPESVPMLFVVSGKSSDALEEYLQNYLDFCLSAPPSSFHAICYTSCVGREHYRYRFACIANNMQDLIARIEDRIENGPNTPAGGSARRILFAFPGQGSQYQGMGRYLANHYSGFRKIITEAANKAAALTGYPILPYLVEEASPGGLSIDHSEVAQVCIFIFQYAVATWLESLGIQSQAVMGHSLGEIAAAVIAHAFDFDLGLQFVVIRAQLLRADPTRPGGMIAIAAPEDRIARYISDMKLQDRVAIAVYNGTESHVVSGELKAVESLMAAVKMDGLRATKLVIDQGFHSPSITPALPALRAWLEEHESHINGLEKPMFSTVKAKELPKQERLDVQYWIDHAQNAVKFVQTARVAHKSSVDVIVDMGPQPTVWSNMQTPEFAGKARLSFTGKRGKDQIVAMLGALSSLFERGVTVDFQALYRQMPFVFVMTDLPTYPFQKIHNYPAYIASRNSLLGVGPQSHSSIVQDHSSPKPQFVVDQDLVDFLDLHRIEGRRVLPGAAMVDFFARSASTKSVKNIRFHVPLVLESTENQVRADIDAQGNYKLVQKDKEETKICSGLVAMSATSYQSKKVDKEPEMIPLQMMSKAQIYEVFKNVQFGEQFRNVQEVRIWDDHADGDIRVQATSNSALDRIRKLDACLHMFGAIASRVAPEVDDEEGAFLPTSLEDFTLHTDTIPNNFTCRYALPLEVGRNARLLTASFEVLSDTGALLISCKRYSVAWVPRGVVHKEQAASTQESWLRNGWMAKELPVSTQAAHKFDELLYIGNGERSHVLRALSADAHDVISMDLPGLPVERSNDYRAVSKVKSISTQEMDAIPSMLRGKDVLIVVDLTRSNSSPGSTGFNLIYHNILAFMQLLLTTKFHISGLVALTTWSAPVDLYREGLDLFSDSQVSSTALVGAVLQGMLRVFRRESGLDFSAWCLDLPQVEEQDQVRINSVIRSEIQGRRTGLFNDTYVSYRQRLPSRALVRLVPVLESLKNISTRSPTGTAVIVGMGSIGSALASALVEAGCSRVVFFGRRAESNPAIQQELATLSPKARTNCLYYQVDVCDQDALKQTLAEVKRAYGVNHIIHTAAVVNDSTIAATKPSDFEAVLRPKVVGSWNLHVVSQDLNLALDSFVLFSSTNVIVGNPGQVAYVSANSFMDSLATYRHNCGLPGASLQLGAWESRLITNIDMSKSFAHLMKHDEGLPLIIQSMMTPIPLRLIARMDIEKLVSTPAYAKDPFFAHLVADRIAAGEAKAKMSSEDATKVIISTLRTALELQPNEKLELVEPLTACGADSITFAQFKGQILKELAIDVPMMYLSEAYTINDMVSFILDTYASA